MKNGLQIRAQDPRITLYTNFGDDPTLEGGGGGFAMCQIKSLFQSIFTFEECRNMFSAMGNPMVTFIL